MAASGRAVLCLLMSRLLQFVVSEDTVGVAVFNEFGAPRTDSWMQFTGEVPTMAQFTVCLRVRFFQFLNPSTFISYAVPDCDDELFLNYDVRFSRLVIGCCNGEVSFDFQVRMIPLRWKSFCVRVDLNSLSAQLFHDEDWRGQSKQLVRTSSSKPHVRGGGKLFIGQEQDAVGGNFDPYESLKAKLADLQLVTEFLNAPSLINYTQLQQLSEKSCTILSFNSFQHFSLSKIETRQAEINSTLFINEKVPFLRLFSRRVKFDEAQSLCHSLGSKIYLPRNHHENDVLFQLTSTNPEFCNKAMFSKDIMWLGAVAFGPNAPWTEYLSNEPLNFTNLNYADDIRTSDSNFALTFAGCESNSSSSKKSWSFTTTSQSRKVACVFDRIPKIRLRGITPDIPLDNDYYLDEKIVNPNLIGIHSSSLIGVSDNTTASSVKIWQLKNFWLDDATLSYTSSLSNFYPFGTKVWTRTSSRIMTFLAITACKEGEFTCGDSSCVNISKRCDLERDCLDGSDEERCSIVELSEEENLGLPPPKSINKKHFELSVCYEIVWVHVIDLASFTVISDVIMKTVWYDPTKLFFNLKTESHLNTLPISTSSPLWKPSYKLEGDRSTLGTIENFNEQFFVERRTPPLADDLIRLRAEESFKGSENPIFTRQSFRVKTKCNIHLERFPFDSQVCHLVVSWQCSMKNVHLLPLHEGRFVKFSGEKNLLQYSVRRVSAEVINQSLCPALRVELAFQNRSVFYVFYTFLPSLMLMVVGYMTFFFPLDDFQDRIMVALTAMLVQTTFFTQVGDHLPRTSYLKLIDVWCVLCIAMLFCIILSLVIINHSFESAHGKKEDKAPSRRKNKIGHLHEQIQMSSSLDSMNNRKSRQETLLLQTSEEMETAFTNQQSSFNKFNKSDQVNCKTQKISSDDFGVPGQYSYVAPNGYTEQKTCWGENSAANQDCSKLPVGTAGVTEAPQFAARLNRLGAWGFAILMVALMVVYTTVALKDMAL